MKKQLHMILAFVCLTYTVFSFSSFATAEGKTRTYYIAVDEINWDYAPSGLDQMMGMPFDKMARMYVESDKHQIGRVYRKPSITNIPTPPSLL